MPVLVLRSLLISVIWSLNALSSEGSKTFGVPPYHDALRRWPHFEEVPAGLVEV